MNELLSNTHAPTLEAALLRQARATAQQNGLHLLSVLEELTNWDQRVLLKALALPFGYKVVETQDMFGLLPGFDVLPLASAMQRQCVLLQDHKQNFYAVTSDPFNADLLVWITKKIQAPLTQYLAIPSDILAYLSKQEESVRAVDQIIADDKQEDKLVSSAQTLSFASVNASNSPAVKLVSSTLYDALKTGASDIHLECTPQGLSVKYRIDGVLDHATNALGNSIAEQVISRIKVLAELDIAERRVPQDGSFRVQVDDREIDLRVSIMPSIHGEDAVIRILDKRAMIAAYGALNLDTLGFDAESLARLRQLSEEAYGMLLVTGPTGSGKTTTLYAALTEINNGREKIITIEDPVEYQLSGILQIPVNEKKGLSFAKGLRSILRHDPDKIMVGEIRDRDTAEIAVQSALTGHLVLTTVHANNVFDVFGRFSHMGIDPYAFVSALNGIWAQRLVRLTCPHCAKDYHPNATELARFSLTPKQVTHYLFKRGLGCGDCRGTGYKGRRAIAEILSLNDEIREMIIDKRPIRQIKECARNNGTKSLRESALTLVQKGETTLEEIKRVTLHA